MEGKGARIETSVPIDAYSPHVVAAAGYCVNAVTDCARIGAWHDRPCAAVPMQGQSAFGRAACSAGASGPNVVAATRCCLKEVGVRARIRACHVRPCAPVPVQGERHTRPARRNPVGLHVAPQVPVQRGRPTRLVTVIVVHTDGPHVVATAGCSEKIVAEVAWVRAWYQRPCAAVPVYCQCPKGGCTK